MESHEQGVSQASAVKLRSATPTSVELLLGHIGRAKVRESGRLYPGIHLDIVHEEYDQV
jgi:hypothetical protein